MSTYLQYIGFKALESTREYAVLVRTVGQDACEFTLVIENEAFLTSRVRYQDAPEICFLKLQRALGACAEGMQPAKRLKVTNADLEEYRVAHSPKPRMPFTVKPAQPS